MSNQKSGSSLKTLCRTAIFLALLELIHAERICVDEHGAVTLNEAHRPPEPISAEGSENHENQ